MKRTKAVWMVVAVLGAWFGAASVSVAAPAPVTQAPVGSTDTGGNGYDG
ncbi:hypothetical protein AACH06_25430 [Ideonella sp. DXS29W]|uniref:Uncharacterized protein n=1 Tax=Ideonella lacteola TaxID=2984193 RepID=A0ABU9BW31_9BURK